MTPHALAATIIDIARDININPDEADDRRHDLASFAVELAQAVLAQEGAREYRILSMMDGRCVNHHLPDHSWKSMLTHLRGLLRLHRDGRIKPQVTFQVQVRDHGAAPWSYTP